MVTYCTAAQVNSFLQLPAAFGAGTKPTNTQVDEFIEMNEAVIEQETMNAWQSKAYTEEFHIKRPQYDLRDGVAIFLSHRKIKTMAAGSGDVLTVWNGSTDEDYLASRTEGRINDFWFDYNLGVLHIRTFRWTVPRFFAVNITYRYGETAVKGDIKKACILLTAADIVESDDRSVLFPEGTSNIPLPDKARKWREEADRIIQTNREIKVLGGLQ